MDKKAAAAAAPSTKRTFPDVDLDAPAAIIVASQKHVINMHKAVVKLCDTDSNAESANESTPVGRFIKEYSRSFTALADAQNKGKFDEAKYSQAFKASADKVTDKPPKDKSSDKPKVHKDKKAVAEKDQ